MRHNHSRRADPPFKPRAVILHNPLTAEKFACTIVGNDNIEGVPFWIVELNGRRLKLNSTAYKIVHGN